MKTKNDIESQKRWLELLEKHKDRLSIDDYHKVQNSVKRNKNSWAVLMLKFDMLKLEYPLEGENYERKRTDDVV